MRASGIAANEPLATAPLPFLKSPGSASRPCNGGWAEAKALLGMLKSLVALPQRYHGCKVVLGF